MGIKNQRKYTNEFKRQALELAQELGSGCKAAAQLGISESNIYNWQALARTGAVGSMPGQVQQRPQSADSSDEIRHLQREVAELKKANYILKQAAAFFSQDHLK